MRRTHVRRVQEGSRGVGRGRGGGGVAGEGFREEVKDARWGEGKGLSMKEAP